MEGKTYQQKGQEDRHKKGLNRKHQSIPFYSNYGMYHKIFKPSRFRRSHHHTYIL